MIDYFISSLQHSSGVDIMILILEMKLLRVREVTYPISSAKKLARLGFESRSP